MSLAPRAIQVLSDIMESSDSDPSRVRAAIDVINRTLGTAPIVTIDATPYDDGRGDLNDRIQAALDARTIGLPVLDLSSEEDDDGGAEAA